MRCLLFCLLFFNVLFSTGYRNHFGHPKKEVVQRYQSRGVSTWNTVQSGAIQFRLTNDGIFGPVLTRDEMRRYWH